MERQPPTPPASNASSMSPFPPPPPSSMPGAPPPPAAPGKMAPQTTSSPAKKIAQDMIDFVRKMPWAERKKISGSYEWERAHSLLTSALEYLKISEDINPNMALSSASVSEEAWKGPVTLRAIKKSSEGSKGVWFLQLQDHVTTSNSESGNDDSTDRIAVAKKITQNEWTTIDTLDFLCSAVLGIAIPESRFVSKDSEEYKRLENAVNDFFSGLPDSPEKSTVRMHLFGGEGVALFEKVDGVTLGSLKRELKDGDYEKLGMLFLIDAVIRNADRMPCRKLLNRPWDGNAGNVMFGESPGDVYSIDPNLNLPSRDDHTSYMDSLKSMVREIFDNEASKCQELLELWTKPVPVLNKSLDAILHEGGWEKYGEDERQVVDAMLVLVRVCAKRSEVASLNSSVPQSTSVADWRRWAKESLPLAIEDIMAWILRESNLTKLDADARKSFRRGFVKASHEIIAFEFEKYQNDLNMHSDHNGEATIFVRSAVEVIKAVVGANREWCTMPSSKVDELVTRVNLKRKTVQELRDLARKYDVSPQIGGKTGRRRECVENEIMEVYKRTVRKKLMNHPEF